ncbi:SusC/RagA family TonB-linked outer membrane protein [Fulvitalea axinellae]|uniref:SusC/RagA family TonB-linked outer membrane protein n=1 Tax=Fulvitalea axinellae TaxID=1182444 RepID=A0AAU9CN37_9BACT|nr:SusC/RagA family TonB-linked outer membrane protein [Fulvitalea axinellae]
MNRIASTFYIVMVLALSLCPFQGGAQSQTVSKVTGTVTDALGATPLAGVQVSVYGKPGVSAETGTDGTYSIEADLAKGALQFSFAGYKTRLEYLHGRQVLDVAMFGESDRRANNSALWIGGGKVPTQMLPYAHVSLSKEDLTGKGYLTLSDALRGQVTGLAGNALSGMPGAGSDMNIRGVSSINANNRPLVVINGMIYENRLSEKGSMGGAVMDPLSRIKLENVEQVTVIKDGGSALYGSLGANGVILVETTRASGTATTVDVEANFGVHFKPETMPVLNRKEFQNLALEQMAGQGLTHAQIRESYPFMVGQAEGSEYYRYAHNTEWQDYLYRDGFEQSYSTQVQGGDAVATYTGTAGYTSSEGVVRDTEFERFDFGLNADMNLLRNLKLHPSVVFSRTTGNLMTESTSAASNPMLASMAKSPMMTAFGFSDLGVPLPHYDEVGAFGVSNPQSLLDNSVGELEGYRALAGVDGSFQVRPGIEVYFNGGIDLLKNKENAFVPKTGSVKQLDGLAENLITHFESEYFSTYYGAGLNLFRTFRNAHSVSARVGLRGKTNELREIFVQDGNSASDVFVQIGAGDGTLREVSPTGGNWNTLSLTAMADYAYLDKYILSGSVTVDGNSRFDKDYRYGTFYSVAGAWRLSAEPLFSGIRALDDLKLRASYGLSGNDDIGNLNAQYYYQSVSYYAVGGLVRAGIPNPNLKWEESSQWNIGMDLSLYNETLKLTVDYFDIKTQDLLHFEMLPKFYGAEPYISNNGALSNKGLEIGLRARLVSSKDFELGVNAVYSRYRNEVTELPAAETQSGLSTISVLGGESLIAAGRPLNTFYGYKTRGIFSTEAEASKAGKEGSSNLMDEFGNPFRAGDVHFVDQNGDGVIDQQDRTVIGDANPDFTGSFGFDARYRRFSFNILFDYAYGGDVYNYVRRQLETMSDYSNQSTAVLNRWRFDGDRTDMPKASYGDVMGNARFSDRWIEDGSYLRLRHVSLSYAAKTPKSKIIRDFRVHVTGRNLLTLTDYLGQSPDVSYGSRLGGMGVDAGRFPIPASLMVGLKVGI